MTMNTNLNTFIMKRVLPFLTLLFAAAFSTFAQVGNDAARNGNGTTDMWDYVTSFRATTGRQQNIACDGQFIYTSSYSKAPENNPPVNSMFYKYDLDGNLIEEFDIPGCDHLRDLAYDGQYFYGGGATNESTLFCVDLANKTLIGSVNTPSESIRHCSYDPVNDGFWIGTSTSLIRINRQGQLEQTVTNVPPANTFCSGSGYFTDEDGIAHLLMFCNVGIYPFVFDYDITNGVFDPIAQLEFANTPGYVAYGGAGGAFVGEYNGHTCFFGDSPASPNFIGIYSLTDFTPEPPEPPAGDQFFDFNDGFLLWTTIDADGDGYNWKLHRNWANPSNPYSIASESRDEMQELPLTPDNYLVSPFKLTYGLISFRACAQDASYPNEHFGVAISTTGNTDAADFTTIWETTMTAKAQGQWYDFEVELGDYKGQEIWVALRHFGCTDEFMLVVDDITLYREWDQVAESNGTAFKLYPNPTSDNIMVETLETINSYEVFDMMGNQVCSREVGSKSFQVNVDELPSGTYMIRLISNGLVQTKRFVKR